MYICSRCGDETQELFGSWEDQEDLCESCAEGKKEQKNNWVMQKCEGIEKDVKFLKSLNEIYPSKVLNEQESIKFMFLKKYLVLLHKAEHCLCVGYDFKNKSILNEELDSAVSCAKWLIENKCLKCITRSK